MAETLFLQHLIFQSSIKKNAEITFGPGLNLIYGPSNTGKSSIYDAIDFMFGRDRALKEIPEHVGYEYVLLGISTSTSKHFTLIRSLSGGDIKCFDGLHKLVPENTEPTVLKPKNRTKKLGSLTEYILELVGLDNKELKKNKDNQKERLTLRNFLPLFFINETDIQRESSPYISPQWIKKTVDRSRLRLIITGVDDSSLITAEQERKVLSRAARTDLLSELIESQRSKISRDIADSNTLADLEEQFTKLEQTLETESEELESSEATYRNYLSARNKLREKLSTNEERLAEISEMLQRFALLKQQYSTDKMRLESIIETGTIIGGLPLVDTCPVCGADTDSSRAHEYCIGDTKEVVSAATEEIRKLTVLESELLGVIENLGAECEQVQTGIPITQQELVRSEEQIRIVSPIIKEQRSRYTDVLSKKSQVERTLGMFDDLEALENKLKEIEDETPETEDKETTDTQLPTHPLFELSKVVSDLLEKWGISNSSHVHFDKEADDFVVGGKLRSSNGKGHRAITHAAATLGLLKYTEMKELPYLGFALLDSPLLAYEEPENPEDDLSDTDVNLKFLKNLASWDSRQTIIFENRKSIPQEFQDGPQITHFTKSTEFGRYGFFPRESSDLLS